MEYYEIGEVMRSARLRHGLTQEELSGELCAVSTLSRIENGISVPRSILFEALMQRMGEPDTRCIFYIGEQQFKRRKLLQQMQKAIRNRNAGSLLLFLKEYHMISGEENPLEMQGRMLAEVVLLFQCNTDPNKILLILNQVLSVTCSSVKRIWEKNMVYTWTEVLILQVMAYCCQQMGKYGNAYDILTDLLECQERCFTDETMIKEIESAIYHQLSDICYMMEQYPESARFCEKGIRRCMQTGNNDLLILLLSQKACVMAKLGDVEKSHSAKAHAGYLKEIMTNKEYLSE